MTARAVGALAEEQVKILAPKLVHASARVGKSNQRREGVVADVSVQAGEATQGDEAVDAKERDAQAYDSEGEREFTGDGEVSEPGHAGSPF
jgi:hypothetical protein